MLKAGHFDSKIRMRVKYISICVHVALQRLNYLPPSPSAQVLSECVQALNKLHPLPRSLLQQEIGLANALVVLSSAAEDGEIEATFKTHCVVTTKTIVVNGIFHTGRATNVVSFMLLAIEFLCVPAANRATESVFEKQETPAVERELSHETQFVAIQLYG
ncbi:unnamed protein product [Timema podura]|uniref:Uncharacterized protein n=1 Tax=Timema podura TaxID=61482 RepID=A0ABN7NI64_TIMPD|nr:unnamed protein product [Timema podura]